MLGSSNPQIVRFGAFEVDLGNGSLHKNGLRIRVQGKPLQILSLLVEHAGDVVTRDQLRQHLWPAGTFVDFEHGLNTAIKKLREALGDDPENPRFVQTVPRHGYRFIAPAEVVVPASLPQPTSRTERTGRRRILVVSALVITIAALTAVALRVNGRWGRTVPSERIQALAVLPLENLSHDPEQEYFADGMTDELIANLAKIAALRVISRTSVMQYKGAKRPLPQIARELNVDAVIEGTVLRSGDRVRITAQLVSARTDAHLWAETYERDLRDVLRLQSDIARAIATAVQVKLSPEEKARLASGPRIDPEAQDAYLRGRYYWSKLSDGGCEKGIQYFKRSIEKSANFAAGYAGLADCYVHLTIFGPLAPGDAYPKAKDAALRAIAIDDSLAEAHAAMGNVLYLYDWDWDAAEREFRRSIDLNPSYGPVHMYYASYLVSMGRKGQALAEMTTARSLDPVSQTTNVGIAYQLNMAREYDQAIEQLRKLLELYPGFWFGYHYLAENYYGKGLHKEAGDAWFKGDLLSGAGKEEMAPFRQAFARSGMRGIFKTLAELLERESKKHRVKASMIGEFYAAGGEKELAFTYLEKAFRERDDGLVYLKVTPRLDSVRADPRFKDLVRRVGLP
jgi:TolB-like protein/DNA-binding winged helix-turn-helix (wHTH) protein